MRILITGATGFVGRHLCVQARQSGLSVRACVRRIKQPIEDVNLAEVGDITSQTDWAKALSGVDVVIHLAARAHVMTETSVDPLSEFYRTNAEGTENLARQAAHAGVKRFVYVSSIKVNGEETNNNRPYTEADVPAPQDPYGVSKWAAEQVLRRIAQETGLKTVVLRPPLIYGPGVKGNFLSMLHALKRRLPLPLGAIQNQRDLLYIGNLTDALLLCATHPAAVGQTYLLSDGEAISTPELLHKLAATLGTQAHIFPFPPSLLKLAGRILGKSSQIDRLLGSLQVDSDKIRHDLGWEPPYTLQQGLQATAEWYLSRKS